jgi:hypothetical protein
MSIMIIIIIVLLLAIKDSPNNRWAKKKRYSNCLNITKYKLAYDFIHAKK